MEQSINAGKTPLGLWWSLLAGFLAWALDLGFSYVLEQHSCSTAHHYVLHGISLISILIALSGFFTGFREYKNFPPQLVEEGGTRFDRAYFQALLGIVFSLSFAIVVIAGSVPRWLLNPCE